MKIERKKIGDYSALIYSDDNETCITYDGKGGAVIGHAMRDEAEKRFIEAMQLSESVNKLLYFKKHGKFPEQP